MSGNNELKQDLRVVKTQLQLKNAMLTLLRQETFEKITVNDICEEAMISRTAFYTHFEDKYALLRYCLNDIKQELKESAEKEGHKTLFFKLTEHIYENPKLYKNLILEDSGSELMNMLNDLFVKSLSEKISDTPIHVNQVPSDILATFCAGGLTNLLVWLLRSNFPISKEQTDKYLIYMYDLVDFNPLDENKTHND